LVLFFGNDVYVNFLQVCCRVWDRKSRSRDADVRFGDLAEASFSTPFGIEWFF